MYKLIVCVDENYGIGLNNDMPWGRSLTTDLNFFKEKTLFQNVVMGSNTYSSIISSLGKPLPKRTSYVLSRKHTHSSPYEHVHFISDISMIPDNSFIVGGASIYEQFLKKNLIDEIFLTKINHSFKCDRFFPNIEKDENWILISEKKYSESELDAFSFSFLHYKKIKNN